MKKLRELNVLDLYGDIFPMIMSQQVRYNNRHRIHNEDLAQHSFMVAYNILKIGYNYNIEDKLVHKACAMAIVHDCPEMFTSDIPHDCKVKHPELREILHGNKHEDIQIIKNEVSLRIVKLFEKLEKKLKIEEDKK